MVHDANMPTNPDGKTWIEIAKSIKPDISEDEVDYILWNETCFPFDDEFAAKQLIEFIENQSKTNHTMLNEQLLQQVREGKASIEHTGKPEDLQKLRYVMTQCFPDDIKTIELMQGNWNFYFASDEPSPDYDLDDTNPTGLHRGYGEAKQGAIIRLEGISIHSG